MNIIDKMDEAIEKLELTIREFQIDGRTKQRIDGLKTALQVVKKVKQKLEAKHGSG
jgi:hypothetical protein